MTDPQDASRQNQRELAAAAERVLRAVDPNLEAHSYPVRREELAARYGDTTAALPNETESLGDVFDRLTDREYDTPQEAKAAVVGEIAGVDGPDEYNPERDLDPGSAGRLGTVEDPSTGSGRRSTPSRGRTTTPSRRASSTAPSPSSPRTGKPAAGRRSSGAVTSFRVPRRISSPSSRERCHQMVANAVRWSS